MSEQILQNYLSDTIEAFRSQKKMAEKAIEQVSDEELFKAIDPESNSIAVILKHLGGNLRSRWTDFLTTDGEKADRHRDSEFVSADDTRESVIEFWEKGWSALLTTLGSLTTEDLGKTVQIRSEDFTVVKAMNRALTHTAHHVGQVVFLAKHLRSSEWKTLSIPRNKSEEFREYIKNLEDKGYYLDTARDFGEKKE